MRTLIAAMGAACLWLPACFAEPAIAQTAAARALPSSAAAADLASVESEARIRDHLARTEFARAVTVADSARHALESMPDADSLKLATAYTLLIESRHLAGKLRDADSRPMAEAAIRIYESRLGAESVRLAEAFSTYARS